MVLTISRPSTRQIATACTAALLLALPVVALVATRATGAAPTLVDQQLDGIVRAGAAPPNLDALVAPVALPGVQQGTSASQGLEVQSPGAEPVPIADSAFLPGSSRGIPQRVLAAYHRAADDLATSDPSCKLPWWLLAGIGRIESGHAAGGHLDRDGTTVGRILGPRLDGSTPGTAVIADTDRGALDGDPIFDRAVGPMQFLPSTWAAVSSDGNRDGRRDPHNIFDAALGAGRYLCAGGARLDSDEGLAAAVLRYNQSTAYVSDVLSWGRAYRDGVTPIADGQGPIPVAPSSTVSAASPRSGPRATTAVPRASSGAVSPSGASTSSAPPSTSTTTAPSTTPSGSTCAPSPTTSTTPTPSATTTTTQGPQQSPSSDTSSSAPSPTTTGVPGC